MPVWRVHDHEVLQGIRHRFEEGTYRFVVLMDRIDDRLKTLLRYVNENSRFDILRVELDFYQDTEIEILVPRLYGGEVRKQAPPPVRPAGRRKWDETAFFAVITKQLKPNHVEAVRGVYDWAQAKADRIIWGTGTVRGSFNPRFDRASTRSIFTVWSDGLLSANYGWFRNDKPGRIYADR
jgi:hypothetical protein